MSPCRHSSTGTLHQSTTNHRCHLQGVTSSAVFRVNMARYPQCRAGIMGSHTRPGSMGSRHRNNTTAARNHQNNANTATFRGHADTIRPHTKNAPGPRSNFHTATTAATATYFHVSRPTRPQRQRPSLPPTRPKKAPTRAFLMWGLRSISYYFHDFFGGFPVRGFEKLCF